MGWRDGILSFTRSYEKALEAHAIRLAEAWEVDTRIDVAIEAPPAARSTWHSRRVRTGSGYQIDFWWDSFPGPARLVRRRFKRAVDRFTRLARALLRQFGLRR